MIQTLDMDKAVNLEASVHSLSDTLYSTLCECNAKDDLVTKHAKVAEEALAGWEKAEAEASFLKQEVDEGLRQRVAAEKRIAELDAALKECMQQLRFTREEHEQRSHDVLINTCRENENELILLKEKLGETSKRLAKFDVENSHLSKTLQIKEKLIEDLHMSKSQAQADFNASMARLSGKEKSNASLKYDVHLLDKELEIRNKESEFNLTLADASKEQHSESVKKIIKLEKECQILRLLVQKSLPGPAALAKMKSAVEVLGKEPDEFNSQIVDLMVKNFKPCNFHDSPNKRINFLIGQLCLMEEENKTLKESITKKNNEIQSLRTMGADAASNFWSLSKVETSMALVRSTSLSHDASLASISESGHEDEISCAESWASALITELEHIRTGKPKESSSSKSAGFPVISLMDDFVEMEKLAALTMDSSNVSSHKNNTFISPLDSDLWLHFSEASGKEAVQVLDNPSSSNDTSKEIQLNDISSGKYPSWLQDILSLVLRQNHITQKNPDEILEEVRIALVNMSHLRPKEVIGTRKNLIHSSSSDPPHVHDYIAWKPPNVPQVVDSFEASGANLPSKELSTQRLQSDVSESICRIIELIKGIDQQYLIDYKSQIFSEDNGSSLRYTNSASPRGYMTRVFQWESSELNVVLQRFIYTCNDLLNGNAGLENFARELSSALDWTFNHCFSIQDVSSMRDSIKKHFDWDGSESESEPEDVMDCQNSKAQKVQVFRDQSCSPSRAASNGENNFSQMEETQLNLKEENLRLKQKLTNMESVQKDLEEKLHIATQKIEELMIQLRELEESVGSSQTGLENSKESKGMVEDHIKNQRLRRDDLDSQLSVTRIELNEACQNSLALELELEDKINRCQDLETTCIELQLQLDSVTKREVQVCNSDHVDKHLQTDWEITAASEKLAECQETILNLGKQLKALASPKETVIFDKVVSNTHATATKNKNANRRNSLLEQMLAEDNAKFEELNSPKTKDIKCNIADPLKPHAHPSDTVESRQNIFNSNETKYKPKAAAGRAAAIVPSRCGGVRLLRKLLLTKKRESSKKSITMVV